MAERVDTSTGVDLLPETTARLARHPRIAGIKEAVPDAERVQELVERCDPDFCVLSGDDGSCLQSMRLGARGVVSVASNAAPALMHRLCAAALEGNWEEAERLNSRLEPLFEALSLESNPIPVKWSVYELGLAGRGIRAPLAELDESYRERVRKVLARLGLLQ